MANNFDLNAGALPADPALQGARWPATLSVVFHWLAAVAMFGALAGGLFAHRLSSCCELRHWTAYNLHASFGLALLALVALRLLVRSLRPWPAFPDRMPLWMRLSARATYTALYVLMVALPLAGWSIVSAPGCCHINPYVFDWFVLPSLDPAPIPNRAAAFSLHSALAWIAMGLIALHTLAALFHHFVWRDDILARIVPALRAWRIRRDQK